MRLVYFFLFPMPSPAGIAGRGKLAFSWPPPYFPVF